MQKYFDIHTLLIQVVNSELNLSMSQSLKEIVNVGIRKQSEETNICSKASQFQTKILTIKSRLYVMMN